MRAVPSLIGFSAMLLASACSSGGGPTVVDDDATLRSASLGWPGDETSLYVSSTDHDAGGRREAIWILPEDLFGSGAWPFSESAEPPPRDRACVSPRCTVDWLDAGVEVLEIRWAFEGRRPKPVVAVTLEEDDMLEVEVNIGPAERFEEEDSILDFGIGVAVLVLAEPVGDGQLLELSISA